MAGARGPVGFGYPADARRWLSPAPRAWEAEPRVTRRSGSRTVRVGTRLPPFAHQTRAAPFARAEVATLLLPALVGSAIEAIAAECCIEQPRQAPYTLRRLRALTGRLLRRQGWLGAARETGAETLLTGRDEAYAESTLRKSARAMARRGAVSIAERALERQVEQAVAAAPPTARTVAYTDMFDQVFWSKRPTHAGPIGNRGNRVLGATYFGLTFVRTGDGPLLAYHVSWHKPAAPLIDALQHVHATEPRASWLFANVDVWIWDRGGAGEPTLLWAIGLRIPFLTVMQGSVAWTDFEHPHTHTSLGVPVFVRPDAALFDWPCFEGAPVPREIIFPAHPEKGMQSTKALRYKTTATFEESDLRNIAGYYKTRWPNNENAIKDVISVGFDKNLDRTLVVCTSRGTDGKLPRLDERRRNLQAEIQQLEADHQTSATRSKVLTRQKRLARIEETRLKLTKQPDKASRAPSGAELLVKVLTMIAFNAIHLMLARSATEAVRTMSLAKFRALLLARSVVTVIDGPTLRLYVEPIRDVRERELQQKLVDVANNTELILDGRRLFFALQPCARPHKSTRRRK